MNSTSKKIALIGGGLALLVGVGLIGAYLGTDATRQRAQAQSTAEGTPVASLVDCPWGGASCVLALGIERALRSRNVEAVIEFAEPRTYHCPGDRPPAGGGPFPLCEGADEFTSREGYPVARRHAEARVVDEAGLRAKVAGFVERINPEARDDVGRGELVLYGFGCPERAVAFQNVSCARLAIILSAILGEGEEARRELLIFWAMGNFRGRTLPVTEVWDGVVLDGEVPVLFETGGELPDLGEVYVIDQSLR